MNKLNNDALPWWEKYKRQPFSLWIYREEIHRFQTTSWSRRWISTLELKTCTLGHLYEALFVRSTNSTMLCSFVLRTLRSSVRSFYELYDALFACSTKMNVYSVRLIFRWTSLWLVRSTWIRLFFELTAQAPVLLERTLYSEKVLYLAK